MIRLRVKEAVTEQGVSLAKLARKADLDWKTVHRLIKNPYAEVSTITLGRIADALGVSVHALVEDGPGPDQQGGLHLDKLTLL